MKEFIEGLDGEVRSDLSSRNVMECCIKDQIDRVLDDFNGLRYIGWVFERDVGSVEGEKGS